MEGVQAHYFFVPLRTRPWKELSVVTVSITSHCIRDPLQSGLCCHQDSETALPLGTHDLHVAEPKGHSSDLIPLCGHG